MTKLLSDDRIEELADSDECVRDGSWGPKFSYRLFARVIEREVLAAAPELEEALRGMLSIHDSTTMAEERALRDKWVPIARAALAKASAIPSTVL